MNLKTIVYSALFIATASTTCAITPRNTVTEELIKPDNAVNRQLAAAPGSLESLPGWYDGKYWSIRADKKHVPAESVEEIWYAMADAPIPGRGQKKKDFLRFCRPA